MRNIISVTILALGFAGLLGAAETAPASAIAQAPAAAAAPPAAPATTAPATAAPVPAANPAPAVIPAPALAKPDSAPVAKADTAKAAKPKKLSKKEKAKAAADSVARADSLKAAVVADSVKAAAAAADSLKAVAVRDSLKADSTRVADSVKVAVAAAVSDSAAADTTASKGKKRKRIVRETTVNTIDELKGRYRSPKKALFMSLVLPGLGQAYVGQNWFNYTRAATYFLADVGLAYGWHYYVVQRQDEQIKKYKRFADENWRQYKYEDSIAQYPDKQDTRYPHRQTYCESVQDRSTPKGVQLFSGCIDPTKTLDYEEFSKEYNDDGKATDSVALLRSKFPNAHNFYEMIGKEQEFITGWLDANNVKVDDSAFYALGSDGLVLKDKNGKNLLATSPYQQKYISMRAQANDYARMQAWFLGGMVVNHIVSAIDAALTAHWHNKDLYQTEARWYDNLHLDSQIAWEGYAPVPTVTASLTF